MAVAKEQIRQIISENNISSVADVYTLLKDSFKDILQELMEAELDATLGYEKNHKGDLQTDNKRNGHSTKNLKSQYGEFQIDVPRDRNGEFEPKLIPKYQRGISGIEEKVISLYARGMSTRDIHDQLQDLYGIELSAEMVSKITDKILPQVKEWQSRPLNPVYPFVFMDCIHYKVREDGRILSRAAYVVLGVTVEGYKDILSITVGANETSKFWLGMLNDLKNRGVKDVLFFCVDGLPGFKEAIQAGLGGVMVGHLQVPALEPDRITPSSLSHSIVTDLLRGELGFNGLVFTDALAMKGVAAESDVTVKALKAGNDMVLVQQNVEKAQESVVQAIKDGR